MAEHYGSPRIVSRGVLRESASLPGLVAERDGERVGLLQYHLGDRACEVVVLIATIRRQGVGRALLEAVRPIAEQARCRRMWLITTNANRGAAAFYRALGWSHVATHRGAVDEARRLKPEIPAVDAAGIAIRDEIEFALVLGDA